MYLWKVLWRAANNLTLLKHFLEYIVTVFFVFFFDTTVLCYGQQMYQQMIIPFMLLAMCLEVAAAKDDFYAGERIDVNVKVKNMSSEEQLLILSLKPKLVRYDGNPVAELQEDDNRKRKVRVDGNGGMLRYFLSFISCYLIV